MDTKFDPVSLEEIVARALREDVGDGDITTAWTLKPDVQTRARFEARQPGVLSGLFPACLTFREVDPSLEFRALLTDGDRLVPGQPIAEVRGAAPSVLTAERTALNFMRHLSGIASMTRRYVDAVRNTGVRIVDTRKTTPGLRELEKGAVLHGGGDNHRHGLFDMVLIKDNHIAAAGGIAGAVRKCRSNMAHSGMRYDIEVETGTLDQVEEAVRSGADWIMLDNMNTEEMRTAVGRIRALTAADRSIVVEASGAITLERLDEIAKTGVDVISVGALTHSAPALDISLNVLAST
ncbi:MAG: carboxylating nicotinate-nucleotide diphosphorylase [Gemmatimonadetes bacterium]|nr:carboxylating nicotinate-nucleotide diphosphorylase [Gemmatimonadota bacterium]